MKRLVSRADLKATAEEVRRCGERIVFTNGCFDLLHPGHVRLISKAATMGERVIVAINDDASVRRLKGGRRPIYPAAERSEILLALRWVDYVTIFPRGYPPRHHSDCSAPCVGERW